MYGIYVKFTAHPQNLAHLFTVQQHHKQAQASLFCHGGSAKLAELFVTVQASLLVSLGLRSSSSSSSSGGGSSSNSSSSSSK